MDWPFLITLGIVSILGIALGFAFGRYVWPPQEAADLRSKLAAIQLDSARLLTECENGRGRIIGLEDDLRNASEALRQNGEEVARLTERTAQLTTKLQDQVALEKALVAERDSLQQERDNLSAEAARLTEREIALNAKITDQTAQIIDIQTRLTAEFENIANRILKASANELSENSQKSLGAILDPLRDRIQEFQQKVEATYDRESRDVLSLKAQIREMVETTHNVGKQADSLARALRGDSQILGRWGELALERILESAGLTEGREYISQGRGLGLRNAEGGLQKPDIVVLLPEEHVMIVDSKVPLSSYERLLSATDDQNRAICGGQFVRDVKLHIDELAAKEYQHNDKLLAHDCVLMFVPIEGALAAALVNDPELFTYAWMRKVVIVGPPTLLMTMRTVASIWRYQLQGENAQEIARLAGDLCDKFSTSIDDFNNVADKINGALNAHNDAVKRLVRGRRNAVWLGERIRELGVRTKRPIPSVMIDGLSVSAEEEAIETEEPAVSLS